MVLGDCWCRGGNGGATGGGERDYTVTVTAHPVSYRWHITGASASVSGIDVTLWGPPRAR